VECVDILGTVGELAIDVFRLVSAMPTPVNGESRKRGRESPRPTPIWATTVGWTSLDLAKRKERRRRGRAACVVGPNRESVS
jgi:hypothetical protein